MGTACGMDSYTLLFQHLSVCTIYDFCAERDRLLEFSIGRKTHCEEESEEVAVQSLEREDVGISAAQSMGWFGWVCTELKMGARIFALLSTRRGSCTPEVKMLDFRLGC